MGKNSSYFGPAEWNRMDFAVTERLQNRKYPEIYYSVKEMDSFLECKMYFGFPILSILDAYPI